MKLTDLKISIQLKIGFGIISVLIGVLGIISWNHVNEMAQSTSLIYHHPLKVRRALGYIERDVQILRVELRNCLLSKDEKLKQTAYHNYLLSVADAEKQLDILEQQYLGPASDIARVKESFIQWKLMEDNSIEQAKKNADIESVISIINSPEMVAGFEKLLNQLKVVDNFAIQKAADLYTKSTELETSLKNQLIIIICLILVISGLIIAFLMRNITTPLAALENFTRQFKDGKVNVRSNYISRNEFGTLSSSFNDLAEIVETELTLNKKTSDIARVMLAEEDAQSFCITLLKTLLEDTNSQVGAVYLLNEEKTEFQCFESIGLDKNRCKSFSALTHEGEFGAALVAKKMQHITNIPKDTNLVYSTVSGSYIPREIITIPIVESFQTVAIISLSSLRNYSNVNLRLLNSILSTLNARMNGILAYRKIVAFSKDLENQNIELESQKKELSAQSSELSEQNIELEMQKKQLDEANKLKTVFLSNMSHELRTPLNSVIALSGVLSRRLENKIQKEEYSYLNVIERNGKHLLSLINDILDLSRIESGREDIRVSAFKISDLIREVTELIQPQAMLKNIGLHYDSGNSTLVIKSDFEKCRHILQNIVANAVKFTEVGRVEITTNADHERLHISVTDTGIGMEETSLPHIFDEFRQVDSSNSRKYEGTGLGLAIARKYANLLGGSISVESKPGKGSNFVLSLPLNFTGEMSDDITYYSEELAESYSSFHIPENNSAEKSPKDKTILLVEDNDAIIIQMKDVLETQGYTVETAHNGGEAIEQIQQKIPDAMILDLMMPEVDGFEVLKRIREDETTQKLPVIILTAKYVTKQELAFLKHNNIQQVIRKGSINKDQLLKAVARMMTPGKKPDSCVSVKRVATPVSGKHVILVVEDNPDNLLTMKALLDEKYKIIEAEDGIAGLEAAKAFQPHLVLMDIALPEMNGIEVLKELRRNENLKHIPVIAVSASAMKGDKEDFMSYGFDAYIPKPVNNIVLEKTLNLFLSSEFSENDNSNTDF